MSHRAISVMGLSEVPSWECYDIMLCTSLEMALYLCLGKGRRERSTSSLYLCPLTFQRIYLPLSADQVTPNPTPTWSTRIEMSLCEPLTRGEVKLQLNNGEITVLHHLPIFMLSRRLPDKLIAKASWSHIFSPGCIICLCTRCNY